MNPLHKDIIKLGGLALALIVALYVIFTMVNAQSKLLFNHQEHTNQFILEGNALRAELKDSIDANTKQLERLEATITILNSKL